MVTFRPHYPTLQWNMWTLFFFLVFKQWSSISANQFNANIVNEGKVELQKVRNLAAQPRYGECWSLALENIDERCREFTADMQSRIALLFTHCHLSRSNRSFPECPVGSDISTCTREMDPVAFHTYTEFFTHAHSICHYLQSESWQHRAENTIHRLTESSAGVVERLASTQRMAEDLVEAQSAALKSQETILRNGEELKHTLKDSTQGLRAVFSEMKQSAHEQQVAFSEIFNRVAYLQGFIMSESHTLGCFLYNSLAFCAAFILTATQCTARARFVLFGLVVLNVYLERMICRSVLDSSNPGYQEMERINLLVGVLRRVMVAVALLVLVYCAMRYRDITKESLEILTQLKETHTSLQLALQQAECLSESVDLRRSAVKGQRMERQKRKEESREEDSTLVLSSTFKNDVSEKPSMSHLPDGWRYDSTAAAEETQNTVVSPGRRKRRSSVSRRGPSSPLVYSILVEDKQPQYNLRSRRSLLGPGTD